jgi:hypothetical protein
MRKALAPRSLFCFFSREGCEMFVPRSRPGKQVGSSPPIAREVIPPQGRLYSVSLSLSQPQGLPRPHKGDGMSPCGLGDLA